MVMFATAPVAALVPSIVRGPALIDFRFEDVKVAPFAAGSKARLFTVAASADTAEPFRTLPLPVTVRILAAEIVPATVWV
jgi:hypothetical protein